MGRGKRKVGSTIKVSSTVKERYEVIDLKRN